MTITCDLSCSPNCKVSLFQKTNDFQHILQLLVITIRDAKGCKVSEKCPETLLNFWKIAEIATLITIRDEFLNRIECEKK